MCCFLSVNKEMRRFLWTLHKKKKTESGTKQKRQKSLKEKENCRAVDTQFVLRVLRHFSRFIFIFEIDIMFHSIALFLSVHLSFESCSRHIFCFFFSFKLWSICVAVLYHYLIIYNSTYAKLHPLSHTQIYIQQIGIIYFCALSVE